MWSCKSRQLAYLGIFCTFVICVYVFFSYFHKVASIQCIQLQLQNTMHTIETKVKWQAARTGISACSGSLSLDFCFNCMHCIFFMLLANKVLFLSLNREPILDPLTARKTNKQWPTRDNIHGAQCGVNILDEKINRRSNVDLHRFIHTLNEIPPRCLHAFNTESANPAARVGHYTRTVSTSTQNASIWLQTTAAPSDSVFRALCTNSLTYLLTYATWFLAVHISGNAMRSINLLRYIKDEQHIRWPITTNNDKLLLLLRIDTEGKKIIIIISKQ